MCSLVRKAARGKSEAAAKARMKERLPLLKGEVPSCVGHQERVLLGQDATHQRLCLVRMQI